MKFNLKGVDLNLLTVFEAIMETGKLSGAGDQLGMSQPAMSAALQRLRLTVDDPLFVRSRQGMEPTPRAQEWYQEIQPALEQIRQSLTSRKQFNPAESQRQFTIMAGDYFEAVHLGHLLQRIQKTAPHITINLLPISADGLPDDFKLGRIDFAVHYQAPQSSGLDYEAVGEEDLVVLTRKNHPRIKKKLSLKQFCNEQHVIFSTPGQQNVHLDVLLGEQRLSRRILVQVSHFSSAAHIIEHSDALCTVAAGMADQLAQRFDITVHKFPLQTPTIEKCMIWPSALADDPLHHWFKEQLKQAMQF